MEDAKGSRFCRGYTCFDSDTMRSGRPRGKPSADVPRDLFIIGGDLGDMVIILHPPGSKGLLSQVQWIYVP